MKLWYCDQDKTLPEVMADLNQDQLINRHIKVIVSSKTNPYWFDVYCESIDSMNVLSMQIVEDHHHMNAETDDEIINEAESTLDIFEKHIGQIQSDSVNKRKLKALIGDLYNQAIAVES
jgi:DNA-directed RNA polymerase subunit H (RpoH/RPB5)